MSEVLLVDKPNTKSMIWNFRFVTDENGRPSNIEKPQCRICHLTVLTKTSNTKNLHFHLQQKDPQVYVELSKATSESEKDCSLTPSKTAKEMFEAQTKLSTSLHEHKDLTNSVTYFLAKDVLPVYIMEKLGLNKC